MPTPKAADEMTDTVVPMVCVIWSYDSDADGFAWQCFGMGTLQEQMIDAMMFAKKLGINPKQGYCVIKETPSGATVHPELND